MLLALLAACGAPLDPPIVADTASTVDSATPDTSVVVVDDEGDFLYGPATLDLAIELDDAALAALATEPKEDVRATLRFQDASWDVGLHLKGSTGSFRDMSSKAAFKIDTREWDDAAPKFYGVRRLTLNNMIQDASMSAEHASYRLHAIVGNIAPRHGYARVTVNGELFGLYGVVETADEEFLERNFAGDDEGNLYEGGYGADIERGRAPNFDQKEGDDETREDLIALIDALTSTSDANFMTTLETYFDVEALLNVWAVEVVTGNADGYVSLANNFFIYRAPNADRWTMIPWGTDQSFIGDRVPTDEAYGALAQRCDAIPACRAQFEARIEAVLATWEQDGFTAWVSAESARIENDCRMDPRSLYGDYGCRDAIDAMNAWVAARPGVIRDALAR